MVAAIRHTDFSRFVAASLVKSRQGQSALKKLVAGEHEAKQPTGEDSRRTAEQPQPDAPRRRLR